jgi:hypothetical protein
VSPCPRGVRSRGGRSHALHAIISALARRARPPSVATRRARRSVPPLNSCPCKMIAQASAASTDIGSPMLQMSSRPVAWTTADSTSSYHDNQNASHLLGMSCSVKPRLLQEALSDVDMVDRTTDRQPVQRLLLGLRVAPGSLKRVRIEQVREGADRVRAVHEPIAERALCNVVGKLDAVRGIRRAAGLKRRRGLIESRSRGRPPARRLRRY